MFIAVNEQLSHAQTLWDSPPPMRAYFYGPKIKVTLFSCSKVDCFKATDTHILYLFWHCSPNTAADPLMEELSQASTMKQLIN
ncbi:hypothetical protein EGR_01077 [Echinococcus granulosus]|uniref:Uncharacterized protein n=1 Tax=Echinococcus granulosus TaxID=6210 RepID=W6VB21_ECHGR|nr:hypothetical protein EGR_01077 [Echinococcus granulosus]EUB63949.1 hypothetical protein EGR_01077 [Echinococcus granulosus]